MTLSQDVAERVGGVTFESLDDSVIHWASLSILDTVGVTLAGSADPAVQLLSTVTLDTESGNPASDDAKSDGLSLIFGSDRRAAPLNAALINGAAAHVLDFDTASSTMGGHPCVQLLPALFALADTVRVDGRRFLTAYVAGYEAQSRIARVVNSHHWDKGWFTTTTIGPFGTAAACAHLLGLSTQQTAQALGIAATFASGIKANIGTMTKALATGHCARSGLLAALLVRNGYSAALDAFEHRQGFLAAFNGAGNFDTARALGTWGDPWDMVEPGIVFKQYPCCGVAHSSIDLLIALMQQERLGPEDIDKIDILIHPRRFAHVNRPDPRSEIDARFSIYYCLACTVQHGRPRMDDFTGDAYRAPEAIALMQRIHAAPHPDMDAASTDLNNQFGAELFLTTRDGRCFHRSADCALGRSPRHSIPVPMLEAKFADCAARVLKTEHIPTLLALLRSPEALPDIALLTRALAEAARFTAPHPSVIGGSAYRPTAEDAR